MTGEQELERMGSPPQGVGRRVKALVSFWGVLVFLPTLPLILGFVAW